MESYLYAAARTVVALANDRGSELGKRSPDPAQWTVKPARRRYADVHRL